LKIAEAKKMDQLQLAERNPASGDRLEDLSEFYPVFFREARALLTDTQRLLGERDLVNATDADLNALFLAAHSIKGGAVTFGFHDMAQLAGLIELVLEGERKHARSLGPEVVQALFSAGTVLRQQLERHQGNASGAPPNDGVVCARIPALRANPVQAAADAKAAAKNDADRSYGFFADWEPPYGFFAHVP